MPEKTSTTLDLMIVRYSVACREAHRVAVGSEPFLWGYVAGWACREIGMADLPRELIGMFRGAWYQGWRDCDACHRIAARHTQT